MTRRGFCDRDLFLCLLVITVLGAIAVPIMLRHQVRKHVSRGHDDLSAISQALVRYRADFGVLPSMVPLVHSPELPSLTTIDPGLPAPDGFFAAYGVGDSKTDRSASGQSWPYVYHTDGMGWVLVATGPFRTHEGLDADLLQAAIDDPVVAIIHTYDPTNGLITKGHLWKVHAND